MGKERPYIYYDLTTTLCDVCLRQIFGKIVFEDNNVFMLKHCDEHGHRKVLIATDVEYYKNIRNYVKRSEMPLKFNMPVKYGCPYDCGLCTDHEQHSCLSIVEITDRCNLECPTCYAMSSPTYGRHRTLAEIEKMFDAIVANEGEPDVVQISGGEPTIHPDFFAVLDIAKKKPIKHIMLNTNGLRIAQEEGFAEKLATYAPAFEIYLQFDSFKASALKQIRGVDLTKIRQKAIDKLNKLNLATTLVVTLQKGVNDDEIGTIIEWATKQPCVRGVTLQPTQVAGRNKNFNPATDRITLTEVRQKILDQTKIFTAADIIPVPCNPDALAMGYALKLARGVYPLTRYVDPQLLLNSSRNTITYEYDGSLKQHALKIFSTALSVDDAAGPLHTLLCCLPTIKAPDLTYKNLFRIIIMHFMDAHDFDVRAVKKSCVHIVHKDGRLIPFETMNIFYRDNKEEYLKKLQAEKKISSESSQQGRVIGAAQ